MDRAREWRTPQGASFLRVSDAGEVIAIDKDRPVTCGDNGNGYKYIRAMRHKVLYKFYIHRLVAECFVPNPNGYREVNHKDGNKRNNAAENLEWCTRSENVLHAYRTGLRHVSPKQLAAALINFRVRERTAA